VAPAGLFDDLTQPGDLSAQALDLPDRVEASSAPIVLRQSVSAHQANRSIMSSSVMK
jgi:hypothetical protein